METGWNQRRLHRHRHPADPPDRGRKLREAYRVCVASLL